MGRVARSIGRAVRGVVRGVGRVVGGVFKGVANVAGGVLKGVGKVAKGVLGSPLLMGLGGGVLGFTIGGPFGALLGAGAGGMLGQSFNGMFNQQPQMNPQMGMGMMPQMGMPMNGMMGGMPGMGMMPGGGYPSMGGMMPGMGTGMNPMMQQQMMMMMMMMMMMQQQMMMGQGGFQQGTMPQTMGPRGFMGSPMGMPSAGYPGYPQPTIPQTGNVPYNPISGNRIADIGAGWAGKAFKPGQTKRCADFVSSVIGQSGMAPPGFKHQVSCNSLQKYGTPVNKGNMKPGDVVFFGNTYRSGKYTHTGIYLGDGKFVHRPTANKPVRVDQLNSGYYSNHFTGGRRLG
ncbi:MAG: C40 family peptidase [Candidatus Eremiobacteraeota bacterium]|nr:C40 family peptidase [Candidatus Eremiobacteraeota bacterium]